MEGWEEGRGGCAQEQLSQPVSQSVDQRPHKDNVYAVFEIASPEITIPDLTVT